MANITLDFSSRPQQDEILEFVKSSITDEKKFMMVDAPTGVGKSYAAVMVSDWYRKTINPDAKIDILTNTKILQDQYVADFAFMANLKGKTNYWCRKNHMSCGDAAIVNKSSNKRCEACPYNIAQSAFIRNPVSLTNFHLITSYAIYSPDFLAERSANLLIIDEVHAFEETFCDFISSVFSERSLKLLDVWEDYMERDLDGIISIQQMADYVEKVLAPLMAAKVVDLTREASESRNKAKRVEIAKKANHIDQSMCKYNRLVNDRSNFNTNWVFTKDLDAFGKSRITVEPIWGNIYLKEMFWDKYDHVILMSGTILDKGLMSFILGIEDNQTSYLALPCPFDPKNRPIIYAKFGKMSYYDKKQTFAKAVPILNKILEKNKDNKGIIHTANYELSNWIKASVKNKRLLFHDSSTREKTLSTHIASVDQTVLVSPSMINGIDLKDDLSRFQIILKVPFPNLTSAKIKKRLETKSAWYNWKTLVDLLQAYGRSIRNETDWAETYILDECFDQVLRGQKVPKYFTDALIVKKIESKVA